MNKENFNSLKKWLVDNGCVVSDKLDFNQETNNIYLNDNTGSDEILLEFNKNIIINSNNILELPYINSDNVELFDDFEKLCVFIAYNIYLGSDSQFKDFINTLPASEYLNNHPINLTRKIIESNSVEDDIKLLLGNYLSLTNEMIEKFNLMHEKIININPLYKKIFSKENLFHSFIIVKTNAIDNKIIIPMLNLIAISDNVNNENVNFGTDTGKINIKLVKNSQTNTFLYLNNSKKSTIDIYYNYNIIKKNNPNKLSFNITNDKIKELFGDKINNLYIYPNGLQPDLVALFRAQFLSEFELNEIYETKNMSKLYNFISLENELEAFKLLIKIFDNCRNDVMEKVKVSIKNKDSTNQLIKSFSKIFIDLNDSINQSILTILFLWNKMLESAVKYNINLV